MTTSTSIRRAVHYALLSGASAAAVVLPAQAQEEAQITEVIVTGSRIPQPNLTSISPVTAVTSEQIKVEGVVRVEDLINNLPQAFADFGGNLSNGATGTATVNLRNLGSERTLVLINGRRLMPGDPTQNGSASPDLNQIPAALIERVEVLTGGASAVYGADAVAGVVNFIMNDNFEGIRVDTQYGFYQHKNDSRIGNIVDDAGFSTPDSNVTDGDQKEITFIAGINTPDGRGNATIYLGYRELDAFRQDQRDFSACALRSGGAVGSDFTCGGSGTSATGYFAHIPSPGADPVENTLGADGELRPFGDSDVYNFAPLNYYQRPDERKTAGLFAHYDFSDAASVYTEFMFMDDRTLAQIAPSGAFIGSGPAFPPFFGDQSINCDNPYLSAGMIDQWCGGSTTGSALVTVGRRNVEGGGRIDDLRHTSFRGVLGMRGDFATAWNYDVYAMYGETLLSENYQNDLSRSRLGRALNAVQTPDGVVCAVNADTNTLNDDPTCVPYNIFQPGGVTPEALAYLQVPGLSSGSTTEQILSGSIAGDLGQYGIKLPTATDGLGVAFGAEYRSERSELRTDVAYQTNDLAGQGAPTLDTFGSFDVKELFMEARLPILQDMPFAQVLSAEAGYRYSDYNLGFSTDSYKFGMDWAPVEAVRFRGSYQRAVRSPNIQELFLQQRVQLNGNGDPCAGANPSVPLENGCDRTGVTPEQYGNILVNPAQQYNGLVGGNVNLDPEESDTYSYGLVFTPGFLPNFTLTLDYFDIKVEKLIDQIGQDFIIDQCIVSNDPAFCDRINRIQAPGSVADGSLWLGESGYVEDPILNTGSLQTSGIDLETNYRLEVGAAGAVALSLVGTYTEEFITEPLPGFGTEYDCAGFFGTVCGVPIPEWRHKLRANWLSPWGVDVALTWRYLDEVALDASSGDPDLAGSVEFTDRRLGSRSYFDLSASYSFQEIGPISGLTARLGINNLTDKDPPLVGQSNCPSVLCNGNTFPQVYDTLGRFVFLGLTADF